MGRCQGKNPRAEVGKDLQFLHQQFYGKVNMTVPFTLPELGENVESADLIKIMVSVGTRIAVDQPVLELETDKANFELPRPSMEWSVKSMSGRATRSRWTAHPDRGGRSGRRYFASCRK